ncbi:hypothetical protein NKH64_08105 [Mesorhizobium sp. M0999]|uniref:hypothetical protein n=1 Tax=Mesorhizobium sp. M0999 TaxID=2957045 RepID=UPI0033399B0E
MSIKLSFAAMANCLMACRSVESGLSWGKTGRPTSVLGRLWRFASKLPAYLSERRRLPPEGDYLRRDIGLSERDVPQEYWQYYFWDR